MRLIHCWSDTFFINTWINQMTWPGFQRSHKRGIFVRTSFSIVYWKWQCLSVYQCVFLFFSSQFPMPIPSCEYRTPEELPKKKVSHTVTAIRNKQLQSNSVIIHVWIHSNYINEYSRVIPFPHVQNNQWHYSYVNQILRQFHCLSLCNNDWANKSNLFIELLEGQSYM